MPLILYVEDDAVLQCDGGCFLQDAGHEVLFASSGGEACDLLRAYGGRIDALVTDINLTGGSEGWEVAEAGREVRDSLPVFYVSASDPKAFATRAVRDGVWIAKPFEWPQLLLTMSAMIAH